MTTVAAADILGITPDSVRRQCKRGRFPGARIRGRDWDIPMAAVEAYRAQSLGKPGLRRGAKLTRRTSVNVTTS